MKIETITGKYKTKSGNPVTILATELDGRDCKITGIVHYSDGTNLMNWWSSLDDLVKITQLTDLKVDDKVIVSHYGENVWIKRHFAGISDNGKILAFTNGCTSWTCNNTSEWSRWRLPTEDEL